MEKKVLSSLVLSGAMMVMVPQAWAQTGGSAPGAGKSGSEPQVQKPTDPPMSGQQKGTSAGQQRGTAGELQSERSSGRAGAEGQAQRAAGQQRLSKEQVKQIQEALKDKGQNPGEADGIMGPKTQQALREFQKQQNLQVTGRVDQQTASALGVDVSASGAGSSSPSSGMGSSREPSGASGAREKGASTSDKASSSKGASGSSSDLGTSSGAAGKSGSAAGSKSGNNPDITEPKKGSTAGRQESTDGNPK